jgi:hypothetical protein
VAELSSDKFYVAYCYDPERKPTKPPPCFSKMKTKAFLGHNGPLRLLSQRDL